MGFDLLIFFFLIFFLKATEQVWMPRGDEGKPANASNVKEKGSRHKMSSARVQGEIWACFIECLPTQCGAGGSRGDGRAVLTPHVRGSGTEGRTRLSPACTSQSSAGSQRERGCVTTAPSPKPHHPVLLTPPQLLPSSAALLADAPSNCSKR